MSRTAGARRTGCDGALRAPRAVGIFPVPTGGLVLRLVPVSRCRGSDAFVPGPFALRLVGDVVCGPIFRF